MEKNEFQCKNLENFDAEKLLKSHFGLAWTSIAA